MSVTRSGKLRVQYLPAVYFDSSVLIDYWLTEGSEIERPEDPLERTIKENEPKNVRVLRDLLKSDKHIRKMTEVRKKLLYGKPKVTAVVSPLSLLEFWVGLSVALHTDDAMDSSVKLKYNGVRVTTLTDENITRSYAPSGSEDSMSMSVRSRRGSFDRISARYRK